MSTLKHLLACCALGLSLSATAQVSVNVNVGAPVWGPPVTVEEYYYLPM